MVPPISPPSFAFALTFPHPSATSLFFLESPRPCLPPFFLKMFQIPFFRLVGTTPVKIFSIKLFLLLVFSSLRNSHFVLSPSPFPIRRSRLSPDVRTTQSLRESFTSFYRDPLFGEIWFPSPSLCKLPASPEVLLPLLFPSIYTRTPPVRRFPCHSNPVHPFV